MGLSQLDSTRASSRPAGAPSTSTRRRRTSRRSVLARATAFSLADASPAPGWRALIAPPSLLVAALRLVRLTRWRPSLADAPQRAAAVTERAERASGSSQ